MKTRFKKAMSLITASALLLSAVSGIGIWKQEREASALNGVLENPRILPDDTMLAKQKVTWDCVYFGSYPQAEVVSSAAVYNALDAGLYEKEDILVDPAIYTALANSKDWVDDELVLNGVKYCRISSGYADYRVTDYGATDTAVQESGFGFYQWSDTTTYHYFKYEPIKWRVLSTDGRKALLLSDIGLDGGHYDRASGRAVTWENCSIRSQLNGYGQTHNLSYTNYAGNGMINRAFDTNEADAIMETELTNEQGNTTKDKLFLLSQAEVSKTATAQACGFRESESYDEARMSYCSTYAKAMGVQVCSTAADNARIKSCGQILRNDGEASDSTVCTLPNGQFRTEPNSYASENRMYHCYAIRPSLYLDLSKTDQYEYAGTVCSDGTVVDAQTTLPPAETATAAGSQTPSAAGSQTPSEQPTNSPIPGSTASSMPSATATHATQQPSVSPSATAAHATQQPSASPSATATHATQQPSVTPSATAAVPTQQPSVSPSAAVPTQQPLVTGNPQVLQTPAPGETIIVEKKIYIKKRFKDEETMGVYEITKTGENGTVIYVRPLDKTQRSVIIPDEVEYKGDTYRVVSVGEHAFYKNKKLRRITLGDNITKISNRAFYKCTNLQIINFNGKLKKIGTKAFFRCNSLEEIVLPSKVEHIGVRAFYKCKNLRKAVLSRNMLELGTKSFYQCKKLNLDMRKVKRRHIAMGRKPFSGVKRVKYGNVQTRP